MWNGTYPRTWSEMSFEFKGLFIYHIAMIAMMLAGSALAFAEQAAVAAGIALLIALWSLIRRVRGGWRWRKPGPLRVAGAVVAAALLIYFIGAGTNFSLTRLATLGPWALAGVGIGVFFVLNVLRLVRLAEQDFIADSLGEAVADEAPPTEPRWKAVVRSIFYGAFLLVWLQGVTAIYLFSSTFEAGSVQPTAERTAPLVNHGVTRFVTAAKENLVDQMLAVMMEAIPSAIAAAFFIQLVLRVRLSPMLAPTSRLKG
jgi:hypothetical protein